jgi:hypothetical protein
LAGPYLIVITVALDLNCLQISGLEWYHNKDDERLFQCKEQIQPRQDDYKDMFTVNVQSIFRIQEVLLTAAINNERK